MLNYYNSYTINYHTHYYGSSFTHKHAAESSVSVFKYILKAILNYTFSFLRYVRPSSKLLKLFVLT